MLSANDEIFLMDSASFMQPGMEYMLLWLKELKLHLRVKKLLDWIVHMLVLVTVKE